MIDTAEARIAALAVDQHGVFSAAQARDAGLSMEQVRARLARGQWRRLGRGTYALAGVVPSWRQTAAAACVGHAQWFTSHLTAAALAGFGPAPPAKPHIVVPPGTASWSSLAVVHRFALAPGETTSFLRIPATHPTRTIIDCASLVGPKRLTGLVDEAFHLGLTSVAAIEARLRKMRPDRCRGSDEVLLTCLDPWRSRIKPGSPSEARLYRQLVEWGLPPPEQQIEIVDHSGVVIARLDAGWSDRRIGLEYDSVRWHGPARWEGDEARHARIEALGWKIRHVDKTDLLPGSRELLERIMAIWDRPPIEGDAVLCSTAAGDRPEAAPPIGAPSTTANR